MVADYNIELTKDKAETFKEYLRKNDISFWPSEAGNLIHIACSMTKEEADEANIWLYKNI